MWALPADRKMLLDIFGKGPAGQVLRVIKASRFEALDTNDELLLLWATEPAQSIPGSSLGEQLPNAIVVHPNDSRDFIAWASTYIGGYRPFTAFFRVIEAEQAKLVFEHREPNLNRLENAVTGLIIGEALTLSGNQRSVSALSLLPSESTYCYSFGRALALGYVHDFKGRDPISSPLAIARRLTRQPPRKLSEEPLAAALEVLSRIATGTTASDRLGGVPAFIWEACQELRSSGEVKRSWGLLDGLGAPTSEVLNEMRGPREHRVQIFEAVLKDANQLDVLTSSFLVGLLADQIAPGTFEHVELVLPYVNRYPAAMVWYGLCAGLHPDSEVQQVGNCLGRRIIRDLLVSDPVISRPKYDISVGELEVYLDREQPLEFRVASQNHIAVELLPGVPAYMKWSVTPSAEPASADSRETSLDTRRGQRELPLDASLGERSSDLRGSPSERQYAIHELERAVERVKLILTAPDPRGNNRPVDDDPKRHRRR